jgi:hypothetical protein
MDVMPAGSYPSWWLAGWQAMRTRRGITAALAVVVLTAAGVLVSNGLARASEDRGASAQGRGSTPFFSFTFRVHRDGDGQQGGYFEAKLSQPLGGVIAPRGPATCVDFRGNKVGFIYPLEEGTKPELVADKGLAIMVTAQDNGPGKQDAIGFVGPAPTAAFVGCAPTVAEIPVTSGDIEIHHD